MAFTPRGGSPPAGPVFACRDGGRIEEAVLEPNAEEACPAVSNRRRRPRRAWNAVRILSLAWVSVTGACAADPTEAVTREQFIDVMVALRRIDMETETAAEFDPKRDSILSAAGVTDSALVDFARRHGRDVAYMAEIWDSIALRLASDDTIMR